MNKSADKETGLIAVLESNSPEETESIGQRLGELAGAGLFVGLCGELGTGKTVFVRGMARGLGIDGNITSPTFQLLREYSGRELLFHFDFYRLDNLDEVIDLDIGECISKGIVAAEWGDKFPEWDNEDYILIKIIRTGDESRKIEFTTASGSGTPLVESVVRDS